MHFNLPSEVDRVCMLLLTYHSFLLDAYLPLPDEMLFQQCICMTLFMHVHNIDTVACDICDHLDSHINITTAHQNTHVKPQEPLYAKEFISMYDDMLTLDNLEVMCKLHKHSSYLVRVPSTGEYQQN